MFSYQYDSLKIEYNLIKSKRKTFTISVDSNGNIIVKAPSRLSDEKVLELVKEKSRWIKEKLLAVMEIESQRHCRHYVNGDTFNYLGTEYALQLLEDRSKKKLIVDLYDDKLLVTFPGQERIMYEANIKDAIKKWYKQKAKIKILERVTYYEKYFSEKRGPVIVKEQKKRWGSCTKDGTLRFNWKIIMAPEPIIDYLVVHEMCHLRYMNHANEFWNLVESILPDYKSRKEWLRKYGALLEL